MGDPVIIGDCTLYLGDCREVLPTLGAVDAVLTDPPYGIADVWKGGFGHGWGRAREQAQVRNDWDQSIPDEGLMSQIVGAAAEVIIWGGNYFPLPPSRCWLVWNKPERGFSLAEAELAWTNKDSIVRVYDGPRSETDRQHPTQKPLALMLWCLDKMKAKSVLDPFMGSGTTGVACAKRGKSFIGIEREAAYFDIACRRIEEAYKQPDMFIAPVSRPVQAVFDLPSRETVKGAM